jgi:hypothetical protein
VREGGLAIEGEGEGCCRYEIVVVVDVVAAARWDEYKSKERV